MRVVDIPAECIQRYIDGESPGPLSLEYKIGRLTLVRRLRKLGIPVRGQREAESLKNMNRTPGQRQEQARAANAAVRGRIASWEERCKRAATLERTFVHASPNELLLGALLQQQGVTPVIQKAVDIYNIDVALWPLAIEVYGGGWHAYGRHRQRSRARFTHLVSKGWVPVVVWCITGVPGELDWKPGEALAAVLRDLHSTTAPSDPRMYVYRFDGELLHTTSHDYDVLASVPSRAYRRHHRS